MRGLQYPSVIPAAFRVTAQTPVPSRVPDKEWPGAGLAPFTQSHSHDAQNPCRGHGEGTQMPPRGQASVQTSGDELSTTQHGTSSLDCFFDDLKAELDLPPAQGAPSPAPAASTRRSSPRRKRISGSVLPTKVLNPDAPQCTRFGSPSPASTGPQSPQRAPRLPRPPAQPRPHISPCDIWLLTAQDSATLESRLSVPSRWTLTRFVPLARALSRRRFWTHVVAIAQQAASDAHFVASLPVHQSSPVFTLLQSWSGRYRAAPATAALVLAVASQHKLPVEAYNVGLKAAATAQDMASAEDLYAAMRAAGQRPNVTTFGHLISAFGTAGRWQAAIDTLQQMRAEGVQPNVITYTTLIKACTAAGAYDAAVKVFNAMDVDAVRADVQAYNSLMAAFSKAADWERAWSVLGAMHRAGIQPDIVSYNTLLKACERCNEWPRARELFSRMQRSSSAVAPNKVTYNTLISAAGRAGDHDEALQLYHEMRENDIEPDKVTLSSLVSGLDSAGEWQLALDVFNSLRARGVQPNAYCYNAMISALAKGAQADHAKALVAEMRRDGYEPDIFTYAPLIGALGRAGLGDEALRVWRDMEDAGIRANSYVYVALINACEQVNNWRGAIRVFYAMRDSGCEMNSLGLVARQILYHWPQLMDKMPVPIVTAARAALDSGRAARLQVDKFLQDMPQGL